MEELIQIGIDMGMTLGAALLVLIIGLQVVKQLKKRLVVFMDKAEIDENLKPFLSALLNVGLKVLLGLTVVAILGIDISMFMALLASVGFAIGLAFQGSLANFAGGVLLLITRPFQVDDMIETGGTLGMVKGIKILYTEIHTFDNKVIFIPNGNLANSAITNYTRNNTRRVDFQFGVGYDSDMQQVKELLRKVVEQHELVFEEPEPFIRMWEHGDNALIFFVRVWCNTDDYWTIYYDVVEEVKEAFDQAGINIPYPQMDVHLKNKA